MNITELTESKIVNIKASFEFGINIENSFELELNEEATYISNKQIVGKACELINQSTNVRVVNGVIENLKMNINGFEEINYKITMPTDEMLDLVKTVNKNSINLWNVYICKELQLAENVR